MEKIDKPHHAAAKTSPPSGRVLSVVAAGSLPTVVPHEPHVRNKGTPLRPEWFEGVQVNLSATERRAGSLGGRRSVKKEYQAAWLVKALQCIDLTTLAGDDTVLIIGTSRSACKTVQKRLEEMLR